MVGGPPLRCAIKKGGGQQALSTRFAVRRQTHRKTLARSEGAQEQRKAAASASLAFPPLQPTPSRRRRHRPRRHRFGIHHTAPIVAAFERICINEPVMAGSNSAAGTEGPLPRSTLSFLYAIVVVLGFSWTQIKKSERRPSWSCTV